MARRLRGDIQGLRAVAVLVVVAAHVGVPFLPGGFVGVDVFFVISGYLIAAAALPRGAAHRRGLDRLLLGPPRPPDPARRDPGHDRHGAALPAVDEPARRPPGHRRRAVGLGVRRQHPLRPRGRLLLRPGHRPLAAPALLVAGGRGAVLRRLAAAAGGLPVALQAPRPQPCRRPGRAAAPQHRGDGPVRVTLASLAWSIHATVASPTTAYFSTLHPRLGARRRRARRPGPADPAAPAHPGQPRDDGRRRRADAGHRLRGHHAGDAVPRDRGGPARPRHRDADHGRLGRRRPRQAHGLRPGCSRSARCGWSATGPTRSTCGTGRRSCCRPSRSAAT